MRGANSDAWQAVLFLVLAVACIGGYVMLTKGSSPTSLAEARAEVTRSWVGTAFLAGGIVFAGLAASRFKRVRDERTRRRLEGA